MGLLQKCYETVYIKYYIGSAWTKMFLKHFSTFVHRLHLRKMY